MNRADRLLIVALAIVAVAAWPLASATADGRGERVVITGPGGTSLLVLGDDAVVNVAGTSGVVCVAVSDGEVAVTGSSCPDRVCVHTGSISSSGEIIACVPNGVVVRVEGGEGDDLDARVR